MEAAGKDGEISDNSEDRNTEKQQKAREQKMNSKEIIMFPAGSSIDPADTGHRLCGRNFDL